MNVERLTEEYLKRRDLAEKAAKAADEIKDMLSKAVDADGDVDENGHKWLVAGNYILKKQKNQPKKYLNKEAAEEWAKGKGFWDDVKVTREELDEDELLGYVYEHRELESDLRNLYVTPEPYWSFIKPVEQKNYEY